MNKSLFLKQENNILIKWLILSYRILLDICYVLIISKAYLYMGFEVDTNIYIFIESYIYTIGLLLITPVKYQKFSNCFLNLELAIMLIPMLSLYGLSERNKIFTLTICIAYIIQVILLKLPSITKPIKIMRVSRWVKFMIIGLMGFTLVYSIILNGAPTLKAFNLSDIYNLRAETIISFPLTYFVPWVAKIIVPFFMVYSLDKKQYMLTNIFIVIQLVLFMIYGHKTYLFISLVIIIVYYIHKKGKFISCMYLVLNIGIIGTSMIYLLDNSIIYPVSMFVRRFLFIPALLKYRYYEFFSVNPKVYMGDGIIGRLLDIQSPYEYSIPVTISQYYEGNLSSSNTGYWGDAYANLGLGGIIFFSIILALLIRMIEKNTSNISTSIVVGASTFSILSLNDGALLTNLLTGGMFLLMIILYFYNSDTNKKINIISLIIGRKEE